LERTHRKLTTHQKAVLIQVLLTFPNQRVGIFYSAAAADGQAYALDFMAIFKAIGWDVTGPEASQDIASDSGGLAFVVNEGGRLPACAEALRDALRIYEIEVGTRVEKGREVAADGFVLWVGAGSSD
jgi:hypothetical protein